MMVVLEHHPNHTDLDMDKITLKDVSCTLNDLGQFNATHLWMKAPFDSCMTEHNTTEDTITYFNSIVAETRASAGSVLISREFQAEFPFKCSYPRSAIMSVASFSPREKVIYTRTGKREVWVLFLPRSSAARFTSTISRLLGFLQGPHDQTIRQIQEGQDSETCKLNRILNVFFPICSSIRQLYLYDGHVRDESIFETIWQLPSEKGPSGKDVPRGESHVQWFQIGADSWEMLGHAQWWPKRWKILCFYR